MCIFLVFVCLARNLDVMRLWMVFVMCIQKTPTFLALCCKNERLHKKEITFYVNYVMPQRYINVFHILSREDLLVSRYVRQ